ncbi:isocitrate lyase/phosphoenolpyruvate mutase family protein [Mariniluteicoccus flavus]
MVGGGGPRGRRRGALGLDALLASLARIATAVDVPVSVDLERGYGAGPDEVAATVVAARDAGAIGANLEDATTDDRDRRPLADAAARLAAARSAVGPAFWINARTDVFLQSPATDHAAAMAEALERGHAYAEAGANSLFVPGLVDPELVRQIVAEQPLPVNLMATEVSALRGFLGLGVVRISMGPGPYLAAMAALRDVATAALSA